MARNRMFLAKVLSFVGPPGASVPHKTLEQVPLLLPLPYSSPTFFSHPLPCLPSEVGPLNPARGSGERYKLPQRVLKSEFGAFWP